MTKNLVFYEVPRISWVGSSQNPRQDDWTNGGWSCRRWAWETRMLSFRAFPAILNSENRGHCKDRDGPLPRVSGKVCHCLLSSTNIEPSFASVLFVQRGSWSHLPAAFWSRGRNTPIFCTTEHIQETKRPMKTGITSQTQLNRTVKEVEQKKVQQRQLTMSFQKIQKKITQFKNKCRTSKKECSR